MPQRRHLLNIQRAFYQRLQNYADRFLGELNPKIKRYLAEYQRNYARFQRLSSKEELIQEILASHLVFCGDYHTLSQAQRTVIRLLRATEALAKKKKRPVILALEAIDAGLEEALNAYVAGRLSEKELKSACEFEKRWGFSWDSYADLFHFAKTHSLRVIGINTQVKASHRSLQKRDAFAAEVLARLSQQAPQSLIFVLIGDFHLAQSRLPKQMALEFKRTRLKRKSLVILQNEERFYWKLAATGLEQKVDVVKVKDGVFCVLSTPPWVKLRSQLDWAFSKNEEVTGSPDSEDEIDYSDEAVEFLEAIGGFFGFRKKIPDNYSIMTGGDYSLATLFGRGTVSFSSREKKMLREYFAMFEAVFVPRRNILFLNRLSLNQLASLASRLWHAELSGFSRVFISPREDFYAFAWAEALGFLGSKLLNHKRKCDGPADWKRLTAKKRALEPKSDKVIVAGWALHHFRNERGPKPMPYPLKILNQEVFTRHRTRLAYQLSRDLGSLLGHALYRAVMEGHISKTEVKNLFSNPFQGDSAYLLYRKWTRRMDRLGLRVLDKNERL